MTGNLPGAIVSIISVRAELFCAFSKTFFATSTVPAVLAIGRFKEVALALALGPYCSSSTAVMHGIADCGS